MSNHLNRVHVLLFSDFESLDVFGPVEVLGRSGYELHFCSLLGGKIKSSQNAIVHTVPLTDVDSTDILLIPGGEGTRKLVADPEFLRALKDIAETAAYCLTVCTGSALLACTGLLDGKRATSNKRAFSWVTSLNTNVLWAGAARWIKDGKYYSSSGVSAGTDMALGFVSDQTGKDTALATARNIEYLWNDNSEADPFSVDMG